MNESLSIRSITPFTTITTILITRSLLELMIILRCLRPHLNDDHVPILQKRVYFCLLCICKYHASLLVSNMLEDMHTMLMETILTISVVSKKVPSEMSSLSLSPVRCDQPLPYSVYCQCVTGSGVMHQRS